MAVYIMIIFVHALSYIIYLPVVCLATGVAEPLGHVR